MRMTIHVPDDLRDRMRPVDENVSWSAIACRAFEQAVARFTPRHQEMKIESVLARLRASADTTADEHFSAGLEAGRDWAQRIASVTHLKRLDAQRDPVHDWYFNRHDAGSSEFTDAEGFYFIVEPDETGCREGARAFWESLELDEPGEIEEGAFVDGFAHGAMEVWGKVKDRL